MKDDEEEAEEDVIEIQDASQEEEEDEEDEDEDEEDDAMENVVCEKCLAGDDEPHFLLCEDCPKGYHIYCLRPKLPKVPKVRLR